MSKREEVQERTLQEKQKENPEDPAWQASISTLENTWLAKFGSQWVDGALIENDLFFSVAAERLAHAHKIERHTLMSRAYPAYRIVE
jgi:hypothetical protein